MIMTPLTAPGIYKALRLRMKRPTQPAPCREPLDHPEIRGMGLRELADLPFPRSRRGETLTLQRDHRRE